MDQRNKNSMEYIRLTQTVKKGGCAAKLPAGELRSVLRGLNLNKPKDLYVGPETLDDACLWDLHDGRFLIQTLDFFTPIVDDPADFGAIAAANALSDVYAMGGEPVLALTILAFPSSQLPLELLNPLMAGAIAKIHEAGAALAGGHSIDDETLKLGFSVTGFVSKECAWTNSGAKPGDLCLLTKPLGTGTLTTTLKLGELDANTTQALIQSMKKLNTAPSLLRGIQVNAATDITGFGLAGHALQLAQASGVCLQIDSEALPALPRSLELLEKDYTNRAHRTNLEYVKECIDFGSVSTSGRLLALDPQTSGGLFLCIDPSDAHSALDRLRKEFPETAVVGRVLSTKDLNHSRNPWIKFE